MKIFNSRLLKNTIYLYVLSFSTQLLYLITIPYQTRVLGAQNYGYIGFAVSLMSYVQLILDFGFILSGTESVTVHRNDKKYLSELFTVITIYKLICGMLLMSVMIFLCYSLSLFYKSKDVILIYVLAYWINSLVPDYIYRGLEQMKYITYRTVFVKIIFTILMFVFVKEPNDYLFLPILLLVGNIIAVIIAWLNIYTEFGIRFTFFKGEVWKTEIRKSFPFFISRIASTVYQATNTVILGLFFNGQKIVGYYSSADKILSLSKSVSSPVADSLYPYMMRKKNYRLIKKILLFYTVFMIVMGPIIFINADWICEILFGKGFSAAGNILRCIMPAIVVIFPTYIICFPVLNSLGLSKYANFSNILGAIIQGIILCIIIISDSVNVYSICISSSFTEVIVFLYRFIIWKKNKELEEQE